MDGYETSCHIREVEKKADAEEAQEKPRYVPIIAVRASPNSSVGRRVSAHQLLYVKKEWS